MSTKCEMHGAVNYVLQEGLFCSECHKLVETSTKCENWEEPTPIKFFIDKKGKKHYNPSLRVANTKCDNNHMTLIRGGETIYDCFTCDKTFKVKEWK